MSFPPKTPPQQTRPEDRVPLAEKTALGMGFVASMGSHNIFHVTASSVYNVTLGMNPALVSVLLFLQRSWYALLDPWVGQFSDNLRSRFGRRRPLMFLSIFPMAAFFAMAWLFPAGLGARSLFSYLLIWSLLYYTARSFYAVPLLGLQVEATSDYHERTRLTGFTQVFFFVFAILPNWFFPLALQPWFPSPIAAFHRIGVGLAVLFLLAGLVPVFFARERLYGQVSRRQARTSFRHDLKAVLANGPFCRIVCMLFVASLCYSVVGSYGMYTSYYYVFGGDISHASVMQGFGGTLFHIGSIGSMIPYQRLSASVGKRRTVQIAAGVLAAGSLCKWVLFQPAHPWLLLLVSLTNGAGMTGIGLMALSMMADAADCEELETGARREGLYASMLGLCDKVGYSLGALFSGVMLVGTGFDASLGGAQAASTLVRIRLLYTLIPAVGALAAAWTIRRYPLTEARAYEIKEELVRRRMGNEKPCPSGG